MSTFTGNSDIFFPLISPSSLYASLAKFDKIDKIVTEKLLLNRLSELQATKT